MHRLHSRCLFALLLSLGFIATSTAWGQFNVPLRINCGGPEITDSNGNTWLADEGVNADPLDIRPNDLGGAQAIPAWANPNPASVAALGFGGTAEDVNIFRSIRWDVGGDADDWHMEIPIPDGEYTVNFYLCEAGGDGRHYSLWLEDAVVEEDAHSLAFPVGEGIVPGQNIAGRYSFEVEVADGSLHVGLTPPPAGTPGAADINPVLNALEIIPLGFDPCDDPAFGRCATGANCSVIWERTDGGLDGVDLGENIALGGIATQSSEGWGGAPGRAIDGNTDGVWGSGSTTHTNNPGAPSWWEVDLLDTYDIDTIRLWNRLDCCSERLTNFTITVLDAGGAVNFERTYRTDNSLLSGAYFTAEGLATEGQFVRISIPGAYLSLAEVEIFDEGLDEPFVPSSSITWNAPACAAPQAYNVFLNDELVLELPGDATGFTPTPDRAVSTYRIETISAEGEEPCTNDMSCTFVVPGRAFDAPLRINMGGPNHVDGNGNFWVGDAGGDPLGIRPNPTGGINEIAAWANPDIASVEALGFEAADAVLFRSIRWDPGNDGEANNWNMEIPIANGNYEVNFYLCEAGGDGRHYSLWLEGAVVEEDAHSLAFPVGEGIVPGQNIAGRYSFITIVEDGSLHVGLTPPPAGTPGAADITAILNALEIVASEDNPCDDPEFGRCPGGLACEAVGGEAAVSWNAPSCGNPAGYNVYRDDELILELAGDVTSFEDAITARSSTYRVETIAADGAPACDDMSCTLVDETFAFDIPLRINFSGDEVTDANGNVWLGDAPGPGDSLSIRPDDTNGANFIPNWCAADSGAVAALGFDPNGPMASALSSIRWDSDSFASPFDIELAVPDGDYYLNLFFLECCCDNRHFSISVEGEVVYDDVHRPDFDPGPNIGRYSFPDISVNDGSLSISLVGIPGGDVNAVISALELLPGGFDPCDDPNNPDFGQCASNVQCAIDGPNKALGKPATQSSEGHGGNPNRATDGNTNGQWAGASITHTIEAPSWWEVDLLDTYDIGSIVLWNRLDCCSERLVDFTITVLDADYAIVFEEGGLDALSQASFTLEDVASSGQYVRISMPGAFLSLAEVQVFEEEAGPSVATVSWDPPLCAAPAGYNVYLNGDLHLELDGDTTSFEEVLSARTSVYEVVTVTAGGAEGCAAMICAYSDNSLPFSTPLRLNMGGPTIVDSNGNTWLGDAGGDPLDIRPNDAGGGNEIAAWCTPTQESVEALGFAAQDMDIFRSIRWDNAGDGEANDWYMELPMADGLYEVSFYLCDAGDNRHYKLALEGEIVEEDVHQLAFPVGEGIVAGPNQVGVYTFEAEVEDGSLSIGILPCFDCPGVTDSNPILEGLEILPLAGPPPEICDNGLDDDGDGATDCVDSDCPACPEICDNGADDDGDGAADCDDDDCAEAESCQPQGNPFARGDANVDGNIDISDPTTTLRYLFLGGAELRCVDAADGNDDGVISLTDAIYVLNHLFLGAAAPPAPYPGCGTDETADGLECEVSPANCE